METSENPTRRTWLTRIMGGVIGASIVAILYPVAMFLRPRRSTVTGAMEMVAPYKPKDLLDAATKPFEFAGKPCLLVLLPEGAKRLEQGQPLRAEDIHAFNAVCTHLDCTVEYRSAEADIFCACHEAVYNLDGGNVSGPPPRPLEKYEVALRGDPDGLPGQEEIVVSRSS